MEKLEKVNGAMILAVDIGNSNVVIGVRKGDQWLHMWRIPTSHDQEASYFYDVGIRNKLLEHAIDPKEVKGIILEEICTFIWNIINLAMNTLSIFVHLSFHACNYHLQLG